MCQVETFVCKKRNLFQILLKLSKDLVFLAGIVLPVGTFQK